MEQQQPNELKVYKRAKQETVDIILLSISRIDKTQYETKPQFKWEFGITFNSGRKEIVNLWALTQLTAEAIVIGFIAAVDNNPYPEIPGIYNVHKYVNKTVKGVWGIRNTPRGKKETILRFLLPGEEKEEKKEKEKEKEKETPKQPNVVPNNTEKKSEPTSEQLKKQIKRIIIPPPEKTNRTANTRRQPTDKVRQSVPEKTKAEPKAEPKSEQPVEDKMRQAMSGNKPKAQLKEDLKYATSQEAANEIEADHAKAELESKEEQEQTGTQVNYGVVEGSKGFFFQGLEVDVTFEWNTEFAAFLDHMGIPYRIERSQIVTLFHSNSLKLLQEDTNSQFEFVMKPLDETGGIIG